MASLRTLEMKKKYQEYQRNNLSNDTCPLCVKAALKEFKYWKIINNDFPYDIVASTHHMVVPIRHVSEMELNEEEFNELKIIKEGFINTKYDYIIEATPKNKSIPTHFHLHIIIGKS